MSSNLTNQQRQQFYQNFFDTASTVEQCIVDYNDTYKLYPRYNVKSIQKTNTCPNVIATLKPLPSKSSNCFSKNNLIYLAIIMQILLSLLLL